MMARRGAWDSFTSPFKTPETFGGVLKSEWIKFSGLSSNWLMYGIALVVMVLLTWFGSFGTTLVDQQFESQARDQVEQSFQGQSREQLGVTDQQYEDMVSERVEAQQDQILETSGVELDEGTSYGQYMATGAPAFGHAMSLLLVAAVAVLSMGSEFSSRSIQTTMVATPRRLPVLAAKALVLTGTSFIFGALAAFVAHLFNQLFLLGTDYGYSVFQPVILGNCLVVGLYFAIASWLGLGLGTALGGTLWGVLAVVVLMFVLPIVFSMTPGDVVQTVAAWLPGGASSEMVQVYAGKDPELTRVQSGLVFAGWALVALAAGAAVLKKRPI